jgi:hypothetical protein
MAFNPITIFLSVALLAIVGQCQFLKLRPELKSLFIFITEFKVYRFVY